jgi:hypothetical protein
MATNPAMDAQQISRIAAQQMGAPSPQAAAPQAPPAPKDAPPTDMEMAVDAASPKTEGDKLQEDAVMYNVSIGGQDRNLSPQQIGSTFERYRDLNHKFATNKPVNDLTEKLMRETGANPQQAAKLMDAALRALTKNAKLGKERPKQDGVAAPVQPSAPQGSNQLNEEWSKYEEENAISLPPGYREQFDRMGRMEDNMSKQLQMMQGVLQNAQSAGLNATKSREEAIGGREEAVMQSIRNNLDRAQQEAGLPDDAVGDFQSYAMERGYTAEDFADANLTRKVIGDFKNQLNTPEFDRLREMSKRREAYLTSQSGGPTSQMASSGQDDTLSRLAQSANSKRFG